MILVKIIDINYVYVFLLCFFYGNKTSFLFIGIWNIGVYLIIAGIELVLFQAIDIKEIE